MRLRSLQIAICALYVLRYTNGHQGELQNEYQRSNNQQISTQQASQSSLAASGRNFESNNFFNQVPQNELVGPSSQVQRQQRNVMPSIVNNQEMNRNRENPSTSTMNGKVIPFQISRGSFGNQGMDSNTVASLIAKSFGLQNIAEPFMNHQNEINTMNQMSPWPKPTRQISPTQTMQSQNYAEPASYPQTTSYTNNKGSTANVIPISISPSLFYEMLTNTARTQPSSISQSCKSSNAKTYAPAVKSNTDNSQMNAILKLLMPQSQASSQPQSSPAVIQEQKQPSVMSLLLSQLQPSLPNNFPLDMIANCKSSNSKSSMKTILPLLLSLLKDRNGGCFCNPDYDCGQPGPCRDSYYNHNGFEHETQSRKGSPKTRSCNKYKGGNKKCKKAKEIIKESEEEEEDIESDDEYETNSDEKED